MILAHYGYEGGSAIEKQTPEAVRGIVLSLTLFPAAGHFLLIPIVSFYKLNKTRCDQIRTELDQKANA